MVELKIFDSVYDERSHWSWDIDRTDLPTIDMVRPCDPSGYSMCRLEIEYAWINALRSQPMINHQTLQRNWMIQLNSGTILLDHACTMERKAYNGAARKQLERWCQDVPLVGKLLQIKPSWGFSLSLDYADPEQGVVEIYHVSKHCNNLDQIESERSRISKLVVEADWDLVASNVLRCRKEWETLPIEKQRLWKLKLLMDL